MIVTFAVTWKVVPGELDEFLALTPKILRNLVQQRGFQGIKLYVNRSEHALVTISQWASPDDLEADREHHQQAVHLVASMATVKKAEIYEVVRS
jgi:quinol monooxygenase YgiN